MKSSIRFVTVIQRDHERIRQMLMLFLIDIILNERLMVVLLVFIEIVTLLIQGFERY